MNNLQSDTIVFINQNAGYLTIDIIDAFKEKYSSRSIIAGKIISRNKNFDGNIKIDSIIPYDRSSKFKRIFTWLWGFLQILYIIKTKYNTADLFIFSNPPLATALPLFCKNKFSILIYDVYPDVLVEFKILKRNSKIVKYWEIANRKVFLKAEKLYTISEGMQKTLSKYTKQQIDVIPIWTDNKFLKPINKAKNNFLEKMGLKDKFIVLYSGNLGYTHDLEIIVDIASQINKEDIFFLIIGEGEKKKTIEAKIKSLDLKNCLLLPFQEVDILPMSLASADIAIISLGKEASTLSIPSKTYDLMSVGAALMCIADRNSELANIVSKYEIGKTFGSEQLQEMKEFILKCVNNSEYHLKLKKNSRAASLYYGPENAMKFVN